MLLFSTAVFTVPQWIFCANGHMTVTLSTQPLSTVNYHRGTQVSPNLTEYLAYHFVHGNFKNVSSSYT